MAAPAQLVLLTDLDWSELSFYLLSLFSHYHSTGVAVVLRSHCNNLGYHLCPVDPDRRLEVLCELLKSLEDGPDRNSCDRCLRILVHYLKVYKIQEGFRQLCLPISSMEKGQIKKRCLSVKNIF